MDEEINNQPEEFEEDLVADEENGGCLEKIKKLKLQLKKIEEEKKLYLDGWQRTKADFINARKKDAEEKDNFVKFANQNLISDIIPSLDNFQSALESQDWQKMPEGWRQGIENSVKELEKTLSQSGLEEINPENKAEFDPNFHEAVAVESTDSPENENRIARVIQKGYKLNNRVIRPAKVVVSECKK
ncbi:MAG: nucleotide exchange factor GrpE [Candidatus Paceibacterota bacterium]|nr:MAG: nucleotide exchange factor GrpE [Candidatus Paceibacterota bacterium]